MRNLALTNAKSFASKMKADHIPDEVRRQALEGYILQNAPRGAAKKFIKQQGVDGIMTGQWQPSIAEEAYRIGQKNALKHLKANGFDTKSVLGSLFNGFIHPIKRIRAARLATRDTQIMVAGLRQARENPVSETPVVLGVEPSSQVLHKDYGIPTTAPAIEKVDAKNKTSQINPAIFRGKGGKGF